MPQLCQGPCIRYHQGCGLHLADVTLTCGLITDVQHRQILRARTVLEPACPPCNRVRLCEVLADDKVRCSDRARQPTVPANTKHHITQCSNCNFAVAAFAFHYARSQHLQQQARSEHENMALRHLSVRFTAPLMRGLHTSVRQCEGEVSVC